MADTKSGSSRTRRSRSSATAALETNGQGATATLAAPTKSGGAGSVPRSSDTPRTAAESAGTPKIVSPVDAIAAQVRKLLGGDNPHQFFTMLMPGTIIEPSRFSYDIRGPKPASVGVAESNLVNQLFDVCQVTASANGRHLGSQYVAALNLLVPRFSPELTVVKNALRNFLRSTPTWTKPDGSSYSGSVQEAYFELYQAWVQRKQLWEKEMQAQQDALQAAYKDDPRKAEDEYIEWYESVAEGRLLELDGYMGKVLAFFSPADMEAILGALDSGPGRQVYGARTAAQNAERPAPDGGTVYPVNLTPRDWFTSLVSDDPVEDLLDDPRYIGIKLHNRRTALMTTVGQVKALLAMSTGNLADLRAKVDAAQAAYNQAQVGLMNTFGKNVLIAYEVYRAMQSGGATPATDALTQVNKNRTMLNAESARKNEEVSDKDKAETTQAVLTKVIDGQAELTVARDKFMQSARDLSAATLDLARAEATSYDVGMYAGRLQDQLDEVVELEKQLAVSAAGRLPAVPRAVSDKGVAPDPVTATSAGSDRFMNVTISFNSTSMVSSSTDSASTSQSAFNLDLFLGSYSGSSASSTSSSTRDMLDETTSVEIGMKLTKVDIDRPWFDPGVFLSTRDLDRTSSTPISVGPVNAGDPNGVRLANTGVFPCYPVAFVLAKDITIKFQTKSSALAAAKSVIESKSTYGGGFLCFTATSSSASRQGRESVTSKTDDNTITLRINSPQIIGWFNEFVPEDRSRQLSTSDTSIGSVLDFIQQNSSQLKPASTVPVPVPGRSLPR